MQRVSPMELRTRDATIKAEEIRYRIVIIGYDRETGWAHLMRGYSFQKTI